MQKPAKQTNKPTPKKLGSVNYSTVNILNIMSSKQRVGTRNVSHLVIACQPFTSLDLGPERKEGRKKWMEGRKIFQPPRCFFLVLAL